MLKRNTKQNMKKYKKAIVDRLEPDIEIGSPTLDNVVSSSLSLPVLCIIALELPARSLGRNIVPINNRNQTIVKITPGEFPAFISKPKKGKARSNRSNSGNF